MEQNNKSKESPEAKKEDKGQGKEEIRYLVRVANTDLDGTKPIYKSLTKIKGINFIFANMLCNISGIEKTKKTGSLTDQEVSKLNDIIKNPNKYDIPDWMLNRRKDYETGEDQHLIGPNIKFIQDGDVKREKKIKSYIGTRHMKGLPVRGQKTKANFRRNKGKSSLGVKRKKAKAGRV